MAVRSESHKMNKSLFFVCVLLLTIGEGWADKKTSQEDSLEQSEPEDSSLLDHIIDLIHIKPIPILAENPQDAVETPEKSEAELLDAFFHKAFFSAGQTPSRLENLFSKLRGQQEGPWWEGSNVCIEREEVDQLDNLNSTIGDSAKENTPSFMISTMVSMQTCYHTCSKYECSRTTKSEDTHKTLTIRYQCCHGFKLKDGKACEKFETAPLVETIKKLDGSKFLAIAKTFEKMLDTENLTVFLPSDEALVEFSEKMLESNQVELLYNLQRRRRRHVNELSGPELMQAHITKGFKEICAPEDTLNSLYQNSTLRLVNVYSTKDDPNVFVNCAKITSSNNYATNGIVHTIDKVMMPATHTIMEIVKHRQDFSMLRSLLENSGIADSLDGDSVWTLFAPTNEAFERFHKKHPKTAEKLFNGNPCAINILKHHILPNVFCSSFITLGATSVRNCMDEFLKISGSDDDSQYLSTFQVENSKVTDTDIIAKNGIVHIINDIILPESVLPVSSLLLKNNLTLFHALVEKAGLLESFDDLFNVTYLIPSDKAIKSYLQNRNAEFDLDKFLSNGEIKDKNDLKDLKDFLLHHVISGNEDMKFENDKMKNTLTEYPLRMNHYLTMYVMMGMNYALSIRDMYHDPITADCARVIKTKIQQCNSILYVIDRPLVLHNHTLWEKIKNIPQLSILYNLLNGTDIQDILENNEGITFTAPVNDVFEKMPFEDLEILKTNKKLLNTLMKVHITKGVTCCAGLQNSPGLFMKSVKALNGQSLAIRKNKIGSAPVTSCDYVADNGVLHFTNKLMIPTKTENSFNINLYGLSDI